jgi:hypothetical protein
MRRPLLLLFWTLLVLYPNPELLFLSVTNAWNPPVDAAAVHNLAATLPDDPQVIEAYVNRTLLPYAVPWETHGVPWYYPTVAEAIALGAGDCQARAIVFASLLQAKGIPARLVGSFDHLWVEYPGKRANALENADIALIAAETDGSYRLRRPRLVDWKQSWEVERAYFWDAMPAARLWTLLAGWLLMALRPSIWHFGGRLRVERTQRSMRAL